MTQIGTAEKVLQSRSALPSERSSLGANEHARQSNDNKSGLFRCFQIRFMCVLILASTLASAAWGADSRTEQIKQTVSAYYENLQQKQFKNAFAYVSDQDKKFINYADWFSQLHFGDPLEELRCQTFKVEALNLVALSADSARVEATVQMIDLKKVGELIQLPENSPGYTPALVERSESLIKWFRQPKTSVIYVHELVLETGQWKLMVYGELKPLKRRVTELKKQGSQELPAQIQALTELKALYEKANHIRAGTYPVSEIDAVSRSLTELTTQRDGVAARQQQLEAERLAALQRAEKEQRRIQEASRMAEQARRADQDRRQREQHDRDWQMALHDYQQFAFSPETWSYDWVQQRLNVGLKNAGPVAVNGLAGVVAISDASSNRVEQKELEMEFKETAWRSGQSYHVSFDFTLTPDSRYALLSFTALRVDHDPAEPSVSEKILQGWKNGLWPTRSATVHMGDLSAAYEGYVQKCFRLTSVSRIQRGNNDMLTMTLLHQGPLDVKNIRVQIRIKDGEQRVIDESPLTAQLLLKAALGIQNPNIYCFEYPLYLLPSSTDAALARMGFEINVAAIDFWPSGRETLVKLWNNTRFKGYISNLSKLFNFPDRGQSYNTI